MKSFILSFVLCLLTLVSSGTNAQSISLRAGQNFSPASHLSLRYEHWTNGSVNLSLGGFYEQGRKNKLDYTSYGADMLAEYATNREGYTASVFGLRYGLGATAMIENDPWVYKDWPLKRRLNYGLLAEVGGEWFMTDNFCLRLGLQQKTLFNSDLGHYRFLVALGLALRLNEY